MDLVRWRPPIRRYWRSSRLCIAPGARVTVGRAGAAAKSGNERNGDRGAARTLRQEANSEISNRFAWKLAPHSCTVSSLQTHAKVTLVVRSEPGGIRRYCTWAPATTHPKTARGPIRITLLTCNDEVGQGRARLFLQLTSLTQPPSCKQAHPVAHSECIEAVISKLGRRRPSNACAREAGRGVDLPS